MVHEVCLNKVVKQLKAKNIGQIKNLEKQVSGCKLLKNPGFKTESL